jgi:hypothetical protein
MIDDVFEGFGPWKTKRLILCQNSMPLWVSLSDGHIEAMAENRTATREEEKKAILSYPYDTNGCRCRNCRYRRIFG